MLRSTFETSNPGNVSSTFVSLVHLCCDEVSNHVTRCCLIDAFARHLCMQMAIATVIATARDVDITDAQLRRLGLEFKQDEVDSQLRLPEKSSSRILHADADDIEEYQSMEATALADAAALRQKVCV
mgnify:FL=1